jgi:hypothetical protein
MSGSKSRVQAQHDQKTWRRLATPEVMIDSFTGTAGVPPAEAPSGALTFARFKFRNVGGRAARGPSKQLLGSAAA